MAEPEYEARNRDPNRPPPSVDDLLADLDDRAGWVMDHWDGANLPAQEVVEYAVRFFQMPLDNDPEGVLRILLGLAECAAALATAYEDEALDMPMTDDQRVEVGEVTLSQASATLAMFAAQRIKERRARLQ